MYWFIQWVWVILFNATFNNISVISWRSVLLVKETRVHGENHQPAAYHWQTLSHNIVSSTPHHEPDSNSQHQLFIQCTWLLNQYWSIQYTIYTFSYLSKHCTPTSILPRNTKQSALYRLIIMSSPPSFTDSSVWCLFLLVQSCELLTSTSSQIMSLILCKLLSPDINPRSDWVLQFKDTFCDCEGRQLRTWSHTAIHSLYILAWCKQWTASRYMFSIRGISTSWFPEI